MLAAISEAVLAAAEAVTGERPPEIERITWHEAMERFGVDKPDMRFGLELVELTDVFAATEFKAFAGAAAIKAIRVPGAAADYGRNQLDKLTDRAKSLGRQGPRVVEGRRRRLVRVARRQVPLAPRRSPRVASASAPSRAISCSSSPTTGRRRARCSASCATTSAARRSTRARTATCGSSTSRCSSAPTSTAGPKPGHHPFTMPHLDDIDLLETDPMAVRSQAYDLVLNGWELGSGSIRIHETELQRRVFAALGITDEEADRKFGFFLNPFEYGAPPHGGFAFGLDRLVAILAGEENIREVIAFPKTQSGADPMTHSPLPVDAGPARPSSASASCRGPDGDGPDGVERALRRAATWSGRPSRTASCRRRSPA